MLAMSPLCSTLGWDYPIELGTTNDALFHNFDLESVFLPDLSPIQAQDYYEDQEYDQSKRSESLLGTSSTDHSNDPILTKKLNHNASERGRRKKINTMYSALRALLPAIDQRRKLSIPTTVARMVDYIPELRKEVEDLTHKKEVILSKISALQGNAREFINDKKTKKCIKKEISLNSITVNKIGDKEVVIQISTFERISISEVLLLLEKNGHLVIDVSSFQSFGGRNFYNAHLKMDGTCNINLEKLHEELMSLLQLQNLERMQMYS